MKIIFFIIIFMVFSNIALSADYIIGVKVGTTRAQQIDETRIMDNIYLKSIDNLSEFLENNDVLFIEPNYKVKAHAIPNDTFYSKSWWFDNISGINAEKAWDNVTDASGVKVAVLDSGVSPHPDLLQNLLPGYNFVANNTDTTDDNKHGTAVAGIIGAVGNNALGITGTAWRVQLIPIKILDSKGDGYVSDIVRGIDYAISRGVSIINASYGRSSSANNILVESIAEKYAVKKAIDAGIIFVSSSGNDGTDNDIFPCFPANYENVISIGSADNNSKITTFSNRGLTSVLIYAPGSSIMSTYYKYQNQPDNESKNYITTSGTSISAPFVSGALALLKVRHPEITPQIAMQALLNSSRQIGQLKILNLNDLLSYDISKLFLPPSNLKIESIDSKYKLSWESSGGATQIFARLTPYTSYMMVGMALASDNSYIDEKAYGNYIIRSVKDGVYTSFSQSASVFTPVQTPPKSSSSGGCSMSYGNDWLLIALFIIASCRLIYTRRKINF